LGPEYEHVIRYTITDAFADSFRPMASSLQTASAGS
jgi:hypothetical protein